MLINIWQNICEDLEDYRAVTVLSAIDYSKAVKRMSFQECLKSFKKNQVLVKKKVSIRKYIDDNLICEKVNFATVPIITNNNIQYKKKHAIGSDYAFKSVGRGPARKAWS